MEWPESFYELRRGEGCPMCAQGRPEETDHGVRILEGEVSDAYLQKAGVQRGYSIVIWRAARGRADRARPRGGRRVLA